MFGCSMNMVSLKWSLSNVGSKYIRQRLSTSTKAKGIDIVSPLIGLTQEQSSFYEVAREFADKEMKPKAKEWDENSFFPRECLKKMASLGFGGLVVKDDIAGGSNLSRVDVVIIIESLATSCVGTTAMLTIHNMCGWMIDKYGSDELRHKHLPSLCQFDAMASYCLTEPGSGSDAASLTTKAVLDKNSGQYVINGTKSFISGNFK